MRPLPSALAAAVLVTALCGPPSSAGAQDAPVDDVEQRLGKAKERMERAFVTLRADRDAVRAEGFSAALAEHPGFVGLVSGVVAAARKDPAAKDVYADALAKLGALDPPPPLSAFSLQVLLPLTATRARTDADAGAIDLFVAVARHVFRHERLEDSWDESFTGTDVVTRYRRERSRLAGMRVDEGDAPAPPDPYATMVLIPRGKAFVGPWDGWNHTIKSKHNKRQRVSLRAFYVDRTEVTCEAYLRFLVSVDADARKDLLPREWKLDEDGTPSFPEGRGAHPVTGVSFAQAAAFADALDKRLPTEDEWERVAAGAEEAGRAFPWGAEAGETKWNHGGGDAAGTAEVTAHPADVTPDGVVGLAGNVSEIVATLPDRKNVRGGKLPKDAQCVIRGGSFRSLPTRCKTRYRTVLDPAEGAPEVGFRCVMDEAACRKRMKQD